MPASDRPGRPGGDWQPTVAEARQRARLVSAGGAYVALAEASPSPDDGAPAPSGPLEGMPFGVKDLIAVAGFPISAGSAVRREAPPERTHAPVVATLLEAGATLIGLTALHEFAFGVTGINDRGGTATNPRAPGRITGGSSSGSAAAVADGSAGFALGTDTGGSVRIPAALCGVVGFKPAFGTYPTSGVFPLSPSLDHVGVLAPSVEIVQQVHSALSRPVRGERRPDRVGLVGRQLDQCEPEVRRRLAIALERLEAEGIEWERVDEEWPSEEQSLDVSTAIMFAEAAAVHGETLKRHSHLYGADVRDRLQHGLAIPAVHYIGARQAQEELRARVAALWERVDCVLGPTVGLVAPTVQEGRNPTLGRRLVSFTRLANITGSPAISLPVAGEGLPVGLQLLAADDERALQFGAYVGRLVGIGSG